MTTTLHIDDDLMEATRRIAKERGVAVDQVVSELIRKGLGQFPLLGERDGLPVFVVSEGTRRITSEDVRKGEDEP